MRDRSSTLASDQISRMLLFLCSADLAGQVLDTPLAEEWGKRVLEEFSLQAELEAQAGLPLTAMGSSDPRTKVKAQHFFLTRVRSVCLPMIWFSYCVDC